MANRRSYTWPAVTVAAGILLGLVALPSEYKNWAPTFLKTPSLHLGLDLAGGTQLDFRISEREMDEQIDALKLDIDEAEKIDAGSERINELRIQLQAMEEQKSTIVEAIRTVLERRINALGVSEAVITPSYIGNEKHLLVECPGVVDTQECIDTVGKTIKLEFKEEFTEATEDFENEIRANVTATAERASGEGQSLATIGEDLSDEIGVRYIENQAFFVDQLPEGLGDIWNSSLGGIQQFDGSIPSVYTDASGNTTTQDIPGVFLVEVLGDKTEQPRTLDNPADALAFLEEQEEGSALETYSRIELDGIEDADIKAAVDTMSPDEVRSVVGEGSASLVYFESRQDGAENMEASHILIAYKGAVSAGDDVTRTKEEALAHATVLLSKLNAGEDFATLAKAESDGPSGADGGSLGTFGRGTMVPAFEEAAFALSEGEVTGPVKTQFGYHLIQADSALAVEPTLVSYQQLTLAGDNAASRVEELLESVQAGTLERMEEALPLRFLFFSLLPTGWKDTLLDGKHFRSATVTLDHVTNIPIVQIMFDEEGGKMFHELTKNNVGKRIAIFVGGQLVSAPVVQSEIAGGTAVITGSSNFDEAKQLATDLNTGAIPAPIYLSGQRTVEATLGAQALATSLNAALIGIIILMVYMILAYRLLGFLANIALMIYAIIFLALLKLPLFLFSSQHIVLTLAGMAGIILSIGMAVDANVLIFERMKEELRKGKLLKTAADTGFQRAWPSIRDGNVSTFITCAILFTIGTSIVRGFAVTLGIGVLISMFSAIVISRWLIGRIAETPLAENRAMFGFWRGLEENPQESNS